MEDMNSQLREARECYREKRYEQSKRLYTSALDILLSQPSPLDDETKTLVARIYNERGLCRYKLVEFDEAVDDYTCAVGLDPSLAAAYYNRATIHYRLLAGHPSNSSEREAIGQKAMDDFSKAFGLEPNNNEFREGLNCCMDMIQGAQGQEDDNVNVLNLRNVALGKMVKLLFLLDNGDKGTGLTSFYRMENAKAARKAGETFLAILRSREQGYQQIVSILQRRAKELLKYSGLTLPFDTNASSLYGIRKQEEDLLILVKCCQFLDIEFNHLDDKIKEVQDKMELDENEKEGNFVIYAENLLMNSICDCLTSDLVYKLFCLAVNRDGWKFLEGIDASIVQEEQLKEEGIKEALFFFIIRQMEEKMLLNRIYTDKLQGLFKELYENNGKNENLIMPIQKLKNYPEECQPGGLCLIFCVKEHREGADAEITKIKSVFEGFKFTVKVEEDPDMSRLKDYHEKELRKTKYRFYDSVVIWFVSHGDETDLILARGDKDQSETYNREKFIDDFSLVCNFNKKPVVFFMATCRGNNPILTADLGGTEADLLGNGSSQDGPVGNKGQVNVPVSSQNISSIYYQMDRLVAYATLPSYISFRVKDEGSVFVDVVCAQLQESQGHNITEVLEAVCRIIHQIVFRSEENKFVGESKQACYYESTFQKIYIVPRM